MSESNAVQYVIVKFTLPFVLLVRNSIEEDDRTSLPNDYEDYQVIIDGIPAQLRFNKEARNLGKVVANVEDRRGQLSFSEVHIILDRRILELFPYQDSFKEQSENLVDFAIRCVNRFLVAYRSITNKFWIQPLNRRDIARVQLIGVCANGHEDYLGLGSLGTGQLLSNEISREQDGFIRTVLRTPGMQHDHLQDLAYIVADLFDQTDYWSAVLTVEILFEAKIARILRRAFEAQGLSNTQIDERFQNSSGWPRSITNLLRTYLPQLTAISINDLDDQSSSIGNAYHNWCERARNLRNEIAHGKNLDVDDTQAREAIDAVRDFLSEIESLISDEYTTIIPV